MLKLISVDFRPSPPEGICIRPIVGEGEGLYPLMNRISEIFGKEMILISLSKSIHSVSKQGRTPDFGTR